MGTRHFEALTSGRQRSGGPASPVVGGGGGGAHLLAGADHGGAEEEGDVKVKEDGDLLGLAEAVLAVLPGGGRGVELQVHPHVGAIRVLTDGEGGSLASFLGQPLLKPSQSTPPPQEVVHFDVTLKKKKKIVSSVLDSVTFPISLPGGGLPGPKPVKHLEKGEKNQSVNPSDAPRLSTILRPSAEFCSGPSS